MEIQNHIILDGKVVALGTTWDHNRVSDKVDRKRVSADANALIKNTPKEERPNFKREYTSDEFHSIATCKLDTKSKKAYSLSLLISTRIEALFEKKNWAALFSLGEDLYWTAGAKDGLINPTTEFSGSYDECLTKFSQSIQMLDEQDGCVFTNVTDLSENFTFIQLDELLPGKKDRAWGLALLNPVTGVDINPIYIIALLVAGAGYFGIDYYLAKKAEEEQAMMLAQAKAAQPPAKPWASVPGPKDLYQGCFTLYQAINQIIPGWQLTLAKCDNTQLEGIFEQDRYYEAWGLSSITKTFPAGKLEYSGNKYNVSFPMGTSPKHTQELPPKIEDTLRKIYDAVGSISDSKIDLKPDNQDKPTTLKIIANFNLDSAEPVIKLIDSIPTLRVDKFEFLPKENRLKFEGSIYVQS